MASVCCASTITGVINCGTRREHKSHVVMLVVTCLQLWARILVQVTIYRRFLIGRDDHLDQSEAYDIS